MIARRAGKAGTRVGDVVGRLRSMADPENVAGMARFGINPEGTLGVSMPGLRKLAKELGRDQGLSLALWDTGIHEARILAALVGDPARVTRSQADRWVKDLDSWDVCDQLCMNLLDKVPFAYDRAVAWSRRREEFVRRAGFALMAVLACHDKKAPDSALAKFLPAIREGADDERNFVKKAVSWALRHIGKRSPGLNRKAVAAAREIAKRAEKEDSKAARWVARDALRELTGEKVRKKLGL